MDNNYYYIVKGERKGPVDLKDLMLLIDSETFIWRQGLNDWVPAYQVPEVKTGLEKKATPPPFVPPFYQEKSVLNIGSNDFSVNNISGKNKLRLLFIWMIYTATGFFLMVLYSFSNIGVVLDQMMNMDFENTFEQYYGYQISYLVSLPFLITTIILFLIILQKGWKMVITSESSFSTKEMIGYLFIPVFNMYWIFISFGTWAKSAQNYVKKYNSSFKLSSFNGFGLAISSIAVFFMLILKFIAVQEIEFVESRISNGFDDFAYDDQILTAIITEVFWYIIVFLFLFFTVLFSYQIYKFSKLFDRNMKNV